MDTLAEPKAQARVPFESQTELLHNYGVRAAVIFRHFASTREGPTSLFLANQAGLPGWWGVGIILRIARVESGHGQVLSRPFIYQMVSWLVGRL